MPGLFGNFSPSGGPAAKEGKIQVRGCQFNDFKSIGNFSPSGGPSEKEYRLQSLGLRDNSFLVSLIL